MNYKAVSFSAVIGSNGNSADIGKQVESAIQKEGVEGWDVVSCENIHTVVAGTNGCFGFGATPSSSTSIILIVFRK